MKDFEFDPSAPAERIPAFAQLCADLLWHLNWYAGMTMDAEEGEASEATRAMIAEVKWQLRQIRRNLPCE